MWISAQLQIPTGAQPVTCSSVSVHPWDVETGHVTPDGCYLSPPNAVQALADKLSAVSGHQDVVVMLVCDSTLKGFSAQLSRMADVLPLPSLTQVARRATTQITQAVTRMQIPASPVSGLPAPQPLICSTLQNIVSGNAALSALRAEGMAGMDSLKAALSGFQAQRQQQLRQITDSLSGAGNKTAKIFAFVHRGDVAAARDAMLKSIPCPAASMTYAHLFTGDLSGMAGWITEEK